MIYYYLLFFLYIFSKMVLSGFFFVALLLTSFRSYGLIRTESGINVLNLVIKLFVMVK